MKVIFENDNNLGAGYGLFKITENDQALTSPYQFVLTCSSNSKSLSPNGWQDASKSLEPNSFEEDGDTITLFVGPDIVDNLDAMELYRFSLISHEKATQDTISKNAILELGSIAYSPLYGTGVVAAKKVVAPTPITPEQDMSAAPLPDTLNNLQVDNTQNTANVTSKNEPIIDRKYYPLLKWFLAIWLLGCVFFTYLLFSEKVNEYLSNLPDEIQAMLYGSPTEKEPADAIEDDKSKTEQEQQEKDKQAKEAKNATTSQTAVIIKQISPRQQVQDFLKKTDTSLEDTVDLAQKLEKETDGLDYSFIIWEVAAEKGNSEAMLMVAKFYNPADSSAHGSIVKDPLVALQWYKKAEQAGQKEATTKIAELRTWAEQETVKGSILSQELLKELQ